MNGTAGALLAKGAKNGGTTLIAHLEQALCAIEKIAAPLEFDIAIAAKGAVLHDIGKVHPAFQQKLTCDKRDDPFAQKTEMPLRHEISSLLFLPVFPREEWDILIEMIIGHHKSIRSENGKGKGLLDLVGSSGPKPVFERHSERWDEWSGAALGVLAYFGYKKNRLTLAEAREAFDYVVSYCEKQEEELGWSKWRGLLNAADHFASALSENTAPRADRIFKKPDLSFFHGRRSALYPLSVVETSDPRPHTLVIAPTGAGKTDFLMKRCRGRVFYTLPFQASINAMFLRMGKACPNDDVRLAHAASKLMVNNRTNEYEEKALQSLTGAGVKVITPYQIAAIAFGIKGYEAIALDLMNSDVILDEIHSYSETSMSIVYELIRMLLYLKCRIHVGSATMPSDLQIQIYDLIGGDKNVYKVSLDDKELETFNRHIIRKITDFDAALEIINESINKNEKILVISNQVRTAQERFEIIKRLFPSVPKMLLHSRYKRKDRAALETKIKDEFDNKPGPCIAVSTQVVEVSLDISFDMMATDAAPLDSMIQRFGRVNRKRLPEKERTLKTVYVLSPPKDAKKVKPYERDTVIKSIDQLPDDAVLEEAKVQEMIDNVYPSIEINSIKSHRILNDEGTEICIPKLCDKPKSVLLEKMDIDSATCITESDKEKYIAAKGEEKTLYEIPVSRSFVWNNKLHHWGQLECGSWPYVIPDELYDEEAGILSKETDNIL